MILNNIAQKKYISGKIKYNHIVDYIIKNLRNLKNNSKFNNFDDTIKFINFLKINHDY